MLQCGSVDDDLGPEVPERTEDLGFVLDVDVKQWMEWITTCKVF